MDYLRILPVDDEPFVMESVASLLEERSGYQLSVHHAVSASAALRILSQERIDFMICDINMPGVNGLQLSQIAHAQWPLCQIIIFTAYATSNSCRKRCAPASATTSPSRTATRSC